VFTSIGGVPPPIGGVNNSLQCNWRLLFWKTECNQTVDNGVTEPVSENTAVLPGYIARRLFPSAGPPGWRRTNSTTAQHHCSLPGVDYRISGLHGVRVWRAYSWVCTHVMCEPPRGSIKSINQVNQVYYSSSTLQARFHN